MVRVLRSRSHAGAGFYNWTLTTACILIECLGSASIDPTQHTWHSDVARPSMDADLTGLLVNPFGRKSADYYATGLSANIADVRAGEHNDGQLFGEIQAGVGAFTLSYPEPAMGLSTGGQWFWDQLHPFIWFPLGSRNLYITGCLCRPLTLYCMCFSGRGRLPLVKKVLYIVLLKHHCAMRQILKYGLEIQWILQAF